MTLRQKVIASTLRAFGVLSTLPARISSAQVKPPALVSHEKWGDYLASQFNKPGMNILEIGSRNVTGANLATRFDQANYTGFDIYAGENVDVIGDAHQLSTYFDRQQFDLIFSSAVFEHLHMPWVVAEEIHKLLKTGGYVFVETHFSFSSHERPWHFFQFSDKGLQALFNEGFGFKTIDSGMSNPIIGYFDPSSDRNLRFLPVTELYCHSEILCQKTEHKEAITWQGLTQSEVVGQSQYPEPKPDSSARNRPDEH